jgi:hypothetical protein
MKCARFLSMLLLAMPVSVLAAAPPAVDQYSQMLPVVVSGVYSVAFNVNLSTSMPSGATLLCRARVVPNAPLFANLDRAALPAVSGMASINGSTATCWVEIPFAWTLNGASNGAALYPGAALSYEIDEVSASNSPPTVLRTSAAQGIGVAYPATGGSARLNINVNF